ncbi:hypothetical protein GNI_191900 [Gregarina niphandrodes]|uniref:Uncharacterized protein n=1 Tax=Gregarina niphandrodes TaxID=110365 RepID=A0A023AWF3_GRENI|nr:hypothetical protein GNI_191900 [Gregarina niphandrodes]EZG43049.1 hypothetical protein GNI_191900 [Gregarina niphandrodes]|eukprot:XP_011133677.1 hypothetical protein GNI_191900 [Gregarina niphandrodes]
MCARRGYTEALKLSEPKYQEQPAVTEEVEPPYKGYRDAWEHPKAAQVRYEAKFEVTGKPHKAVRGRRHYEPEMRRELESQVKRRLELGVIRPSKSDGGSTTLCQEKDWRVEVRIRLPETERIDGIRLLPTAEDLGSPAEGGRT